MGRRASLKLDYDGFYFIPLGGSEQFGVNLNVYAHRNEYLAVDCGIGFADERFPGIDLLLPDPEFLEQRAERLAGLIITHAHEDHIGAVPYLWNRLECPIYCGEFTAEILRAKFKDIDGKSPDIHVVKAHETVQIGTFQVKFIPVSHSVPEAFALAVETAQGQVLHSGDWNLDPKPVVGLPTNGDDFRALAEKGPVLAYIGDSTNAEVPGVSGSEADVETGLYEEFKLCRAKIVVTMFSSNIGRMISIARAARKCDRNVGVIGRSLHRMISAARKCGMLEGIEFVDESDFGLIPDDKLVVIMTGSQGEYRAALPKLARGDLRGFKLNPRDTVIFSARPIPGNEKDINAVKNNLSGSGVQIVGPRDTKNVIHVSGHPCRDEISAMFQWLRPQSVIPVHGERTQLEAHAKFAHECQVPNVVIPSNGSVVQLAPGMPRIVDHVETGLLAVDQKRIIAADHKSITARRKLQYTGVIHATLVLNARGELVGDPKLDTVGLVDEDNPGEEKIVQSLYEEIFELLDDMSWEERLDDHFIQEEMRIGLRRFVDHFLGFKPQTSVHVMRI